MGSFGLGHWLVVLVIVLLLFGAGRLSDIGKGLGEGIKNFKKGLNDDDDPSARSAIKTQELEATPSPKQLVDVPKKKRVIEVEVDDDDDDAAVARKIAESKKASSKTDA